MTLKMTEKNKKEYIIKLQDLKTKEIKDVPYSYDRNEYEITNIQLNPDDDFVTFLWTDGDHDCDCKRFYYFYSRKPSGVDCDKECSGQMHRFKLLLITSADDGKIIHAEGDSDFEYWKEEYDPRYDNFADE